LNHFEDGFFYNTFAIYAYYLIDFTRSNLYHVLFLDVIDKKEIKFYL